MQPSIGTVVSSNSHVVTRGGFAPLNPTPNKFSIWASHYHVGSTIPGGLSKDVKEITEHAIDAFSFLLPSKRFSGPEFASIIRERYDNDQTNRIASVLEVL